MKKFLATLLFASLLISGCGDNAQQKAEEVKQDATQKVEEVKQDANKAAEEVKQDAAQKTNELIDATKSLFKDSREIPLAGVLPGVTLEKLIQSFGEPVSRDDDDITFGNGLKIELDDVKNIVEKIVIRTPEIVTPEGVAVGMEEAAIKNSYGTADKVENDDGEVEYKYFSRDNKKSITFTARDGVITKIESELRD